MLGGVVRFIQFCGAGLLTIVLAAGAAYGHAPLIIGAMALAITIVVCVRSVRAAWALYFLSVSLTGVTAGLGTALVRPEMLAFPLLLLACLRVWPVRARKGEDLPKPAVLPISLLALAIVFAAVMIGTSMVNAPEPVRSLWIALQMLLGIAAYMVLSPDEAAKRDMVLTGTAVLGLIAGISVLGWIGRTYLGLPQEAAVGVAADGRLIGFSFETNIFASQSMGWLAVLYCWRGRLSPWTRIPTGALVVAVALAGTRAAWLALALLAVVFVWRTWSRSQLLVPVGATVLIFGGLYVALVAAPTALIAPKDSLQWRLLHLFDTKSGTGAYRANIYQTAIADIDTPMRWLFGSGMNSFSQYHEIDSTGTGAPYLSSVWYATLYDVGLVGLLLFLVLLTGLVLRCRVRSDGLVLIAVLLICASATNLFWLSYPWVYLALVSDRQLAQGDSISSASRARSSRNHSGRRGAGWGARPAPSVGADMPLVGSSRRRNTRDQQIRK
jgi:hypothetical protein